MELSDRERASTDPIQGVLHPVPREPSAASHAAGPVRGILRLAALLGLILLPIGSPALAEAFEITLVSSGDSAIYDRVAKAFESALERLCGVQTGAACRKVNVIRSTLEEAETLPDGQGLVVTIGSGTARRLAREPLKRPVVHTLLPEAAYQQLKADSRIERHTALFLEQPLERQLKLAELLAPGDSHIGVLLGPTNHALETLFRDHFNSGHAQQIEIEQVTDPDEIGFKLNRLLKRSDLLLALPEPSVYNRGTVRTILLSTYHRKRPVIGYSASYVKAGALAAVYSTPQQIGECTASMVKEYLASENETLPPPRHPRQFSVDINTRVAESLGIAPPAAADLEAQLRERERP